MNEKKNASGPEDAAKSNRPAPGDARSSSLTTLLASFDALPDRVRRTIKVIGFVGALATVWFLSRVNTPAVPVATLPAALADATPNELAERLALARTRRELFILQGRTVESTLKQLDEIVEKWAGVKDLQTNDEGKLLAANPDFVSALTALLQTPRPSVEEAASMRQAYRSLVEPVQMAHQVSQSTYVPAEDVFHQLANIRIEAERMLDQFRKDLSTVDGMRSAARQQNSVAPQTLAETYSRQKQAEAVEFAKMLAEREQRVRREAEERLAAASEQKIRALADEQVKLIDAQTNKESLVIRAGRQDIKALYAPFLEKGRLRPHRDRLETPGPMSYADLKILGVFDDHKTFARAGAGCWRHEHMPENCVELGNDRSRWPMPQHEEDFDKYRKSFEQFKELAPIWAQDGTLAP